MALWGGVIADEIHAHLEEFHFLSGMLHSQSPIKNLNFYLVVTSIVMVLRMEH